MARTRTVTARRPVGRLIRNGLVSGVLGSIAATVIAIAADASGAALTVAGTPVPFTAFAFWTLVATAVGVALAAWLNDARRLVTVTVALTALSTIPSLLWADGMTGKLLLTATHIVAAAIVIPILAAPLRPGISR